MRFEYVMRGGGERRGARGGGPPPLAVLVALFAACEPDSAPPTAGQLLPEGVEMAQTAMRTVVTRQGIRRAVVEGDTAEWHGENEVHLRPMRIIFYDVNGNQSSEVTSVYGIYDELTGDLQTEGDVVAVDYVDGQRLETERMRYVNAEGRLYGDTLFRLSRDVGTMLIEGSAFESDPALDSVIVLNPEGETRPPIITVADTTPAAADTTPAAADTTPVSQDTVETEVPAFVAEDTEATRPDTMAARDSLVAPPDKTVARDSLVAPPDKTVARDSLVAPPDTTVARDSLVAPPDTTVARDSLVAPPDTTVARDSLVAPPDTTVARDSLVAPPDKTVARDSLVAPPDTTVARDSLVAPPDTAVAQDTTGAPPDTTARR
ncbi:hypothetical protein [Candidatus Palauibacter sp.]|uniref:hypothetical protein n=1 Tax=Candidatus Palauibacter sp. TaxID=3101350 RepID=UPI003B5C3D17